MEEKKYDVVIAGAGPAGAQCARDLALNYDVILLEQSQKLGYPKQSTGGTFPPIMTEFNIPKESVTMNDTDYVKIESPNYNSYWEVPGYVLEFGDFKKYLAKDAKNKGAEVCTGSSVTKPINKNGEIFTQESEKNGPIGGVKYKDKKDNEIKDIYGDIVIDATGAKARLASQLGLRRTKRENHGKGLEYEFEGVKMDLKNSMVMILDNNIAPGGYGWIFHTGGNSAKVGVCWINRKHHKQRKEKNVSGMDYLDRLLEDPRLRNAKKKEDEELHAGGAYFSSPDKIYSDRFLLIGDVCSSIDPLWGEGIYNCLKSGRIAANTVEKALRDGNTKSEKLSLYEEEWKRLVTKNWGRRKLLAELLYSMENKRFDKLVRDLNKLSNEKLSRINQGSLIDLIYIMKLSDIPRIARYSIKSIKNSL